MTMGPDGPKGFLADFIADPKHYERDIKTLQASLRLQGMYDGKVDGKLSDNLSEAAKKFVDKYNVHEKRQEGRALAIESSEKLFKNGDITELKDEVIAKGKSGDPEDQKAFNQIRKEYELDQNGIYRDKSAAVENRPPFQVAIASTKADITDSRAVGSEIPIGPQNRVSMSPMTV